MTNQKREIEPETLLARLLRGAGRGPVASPEAKARIYDAVHTEWRSNVTTNEPHHNRRPPSRASSAWLGWWLARSVPVAATLGIAVAIFYLTNVPTPASGVEVATVTKSIGSVAVTGGGAAQPLTQPTDSRIIRTGDTVVTGRDGGLSLMLRDNIIVRLNADTQIVMSGVDQLDVRRGAIYLDTRAGAQPSGEMEINTPFGVVRHLGTQYEVSVRAEDLRLRVREGEVMVSDGAREYVGGAGEQLVLASDAEPIRSSITTSGPAWAWVESLATLPAADQYRLIDLLEWIARETGRELQFSSDALALNAERDTLVGAAGLNPTETLEVIRSTTALRIEVAGQALLIR